VIVTPAKDVKLPDNAAQALLDELTARAKIAVDQAALRQEQAASERRAAIEKELAAAQEKYSKIQSQLRDARAMAAGMSGGGGGGGADPSGRGIAHEMQQAEVNIAAQRARLKVIEEEIAKLSAGKPADAPKKPELKAAWAELIAAREAAVHAAHNTPDSPENRVMIAQAQAELAEVKIRAATAADAARPPGFDSPDRWQGERITLRASIAEQEARLGALSERLAVLQKKNEPPTQPVTVYDIDRLQRDESRARQEVDELSNQLDQLRRERRGAGSAPRLLVLDGRGDTAKE
jgi:predicted  nucleic acid-binding Zn-ribbon protein